MGQSVTVVAKPSSNPEVLRFEINRSLTGMGHERYSSPADAVLDRPVDRLATRLFAAGGVEGVHVNSSVITVHLAGGSSGAGLEDIIRNLFRYYPDEPATADEPGAVADADPAGAVPAADVPVAEAPADAPAAEAPADAAAADASAAGDATETADA